MKSKCFRVIMSIKRVQPFNAIQSAWPISHKHLYCKSYLRQACIVLKAEIADGIGHLSTQVAFQGSAVK